MDRGLNGLISMLGFLFGVLYQWMERTLVNALHSTLQHTYSTESEMKRECAEGEAQRHVLHGNEPSKTGAGACSARAPSVTKTN